MKTNCQTRSTEAVHIEFGNPTIKCARFGICQMNFARPKLKKCKGVQSANGRVVNLNGRLGLEFQMKDLSTGIFQSYFNGVFIIETNTKIPDLILNRIGLDWIIIPKGEYPIVIKGDFVLVTFNKNN